MCYNSLRPTSRVQFSWENNFAVSATLFAGPFSGKGRGGPLTVSYLPFHAVSAAIQRPFAVMGPIAEFVISVQEFLCYRPLSTSWGNCQPLPLGRGKEHSIRGEGTLYIRGERTFYKRRRNTLQEAKEHSIRGEGTLYKRRRITL